MDLGKIEKLQLVDGELQNSNTFGPMKGLQKAFRKLKNKEKLLEEDTTSLVNFVVCWTCVGSILGQVDVIM